jgi:hypothetical protein
VDEIELFTALRPTSDTDLTGQRERARARLAGAMSGTRVSGRHPGRRPGGLNSPTRTVFTVGGAALAVGGATVLAAVLPAVLSSGRSGPLITSAWAVQPGKDGTVKVTIKDATDPAGLERALRTAGVRAAVVFPPEVTAKVSGNAWMTYPSCTYRTSGPLFAPAAVQRAVVTLPRPARVSSAGLSEVIAVIHPAAMPPNSVLFIVDSFTVRRDGSHVLWVRSPAVLKSDKLPHCQRSAVPAPVPSATPAPPTPVPSTPASPQPTTTPVPVPSASASPEPSASPTMSPEPTPSASPTRPSSPSPSASPHPTRTHSPEPAPVPSRLASPSPMPS